MNEEVMFFLICYGLMAMLLTYCCMDALRFLNNWGDRILYVISCLLQKPILLPVILGGKCFQSPVANKRFGNHIDFKVDGIEQTKFMLAV